MEFHDWEPVYETILADMGFDRTGDERARDLLATLVGDGGQPPVSGTGSGAGASDAAGRSDDSGERRLDGDTARVDAPTDSDSGPLGPGALDFAGQTVAVVGPGPSLPAELDRVRDADAVVAASDAAAVVRSADLAVDCMVTDLDEQGDAARELTAAGTPVAVHAHGDNRPALRERVPELAVEWVLPTTQAAPTGPVVNPGGFTDGDRAAFLADRCGAAGLVFPGWDLDDPDVDPLKRRKLVWAERLLRWLERRRNERFAVLEGRRDAIDESALPG